MPTEDRPEDSSKNLQIKDSKTYENLTFYRYQVIPQGR